MENENDRNRSSQDLYPHISPVKVGFLGIIAVFFLYQIGGSILTFAIFGFELENADVNALRLLTMGGQIMLILLPALIFSKMIYENVESIIRFKIPEPKEIIVFVIGLVILIPLLQSFLFVQNYFIDYLSSSVKIIGDLKELFDKLDKYIEQTYGRLLFADSVFEASFIILVVALTPAICEEIFFRGFIQKSFEFRIKPFWSAVITAVFFGLYHFNPYGLVALIILGTYFGFASYTSNSIFIPMILHFLNNFFAVTLYFFYGEEDVFSSTSAESGSILFSLASLLFLIFVFSLFIYFIKRNYSKISGVKNDMSEL